MTKATTANDGGIASPFRIQAGFLRELGTPDYTGAMPEGAFMLTTAPRGGPHKVRRRGHWSERDLRRAIDVARRAGLKDYRVEIGPDGTISLVVATQQRRPLQR